MGDNRLAKIARDSRPQGVRSRGRPKKRWKESLIKAPSPWPLEEQALAYWEEEEGEEEEEEEEGEKTRLEKCWGIYTGKGLARK